MAKKGCKVRYYEMEPKSRMLTPTTYQQAVKCVGGARNLLKTARNKACAKGSGTAKKKGVGCKVFIYKV